jgi:uncharacterized membrane protein HdeD (DUF308 family)
MLEALARNWWLVFFRGVFAVVFGLLALGWPGVTLGALVLLYGVYALASGVLALLSAFSGRSARSPWMLVLEGVVGIGAAAAAFLWPALTALVLLYIIAFWAILSGVFEIAAAIRLRKEIEGEWLLALSGIASLAFGALLILRPAAGAVAVVWLIGAYAILFGGLLIALGLRLRSWRDHAAEPGGGAAA